MESSFPKKHCISSAPTIIGQAALSNSYVFRSNFYPGEEEYPRRKVKLPVDLLIRSFWGGLDPPLL